MRAPWSRGRASSAAALSLALLSPLVGCNDTEHVDLAFRAAEGSRASYAIAVESKVTTELGGPPEETTEDITLTAEQVVTGSSDEGAALQITMARVGRPARVFEVRLDTARGLAEVDAVEGLSVEALGEVGPSRLILLASGFLPGRAERPGAEWPIERDLELPEGSEHLTGRGRLVGLRVDDDVELARVRASTSLPVDRRMLLPEGSVRLHGIERTTAVLDYDVGDGTVHSAESVTTGTFDLLVTAPGGDLAPLEGTLSVRVESTTRRLIEAGAVAYLPTGR